MKILLIRANSVDPDPRVEKEVFSLIKGGHDICVLAWDRSDDHAVAKSFLHEADLQCPIFRIGVKASWGGGIRNNFFKFFSFIKAAKKWVKLNIKNFDCVHLCDLPIAYPLYKIALRNHKKFIYDIFDYYPDLRPYSFPLRIAFVLMERRCIKKADATIICSESRFAQIRGSHPQKIVVIHNSPRDFDVNPQKSNTHFIIEENKVSICYVGNLVADRLVLPLCEAVSSRKDVCLYIGGIGILSNEIRHFSERYANIHYVGKLSYSDVLSLERQCDILAAFYDPSVPNHKYAAPNKFYEALSLGKPLLMCKGAGFDDFFHRHDFGILVDPSAEGISKGISNVLSAKNEWPRFSQEEKSLFMNEYSWSIMEKRLLLLYKQIDFADEGK